MSKTERENALNHLNIFMDRSASIRVSFPKLFMATMEELVLESMKGEGKCIIEKMGGFSRILGARLHNELTPFVDIVVVGHNGAEYSILCTSIQKSKTGRIILGTLDINKTNEELEMSLVHGMAEQVGNMNFEGIPCRSFGDMISAFSGSTR
jgi:hypothetical protein